MEELSSKAPEYDLFAIGCHYTSGWFAMVLSFNFRRNQLRAAWNSISKEKPSALMKGLKEIYIRSKFQEQSLTNQ